VEALGSSAAGPRSAAGQGDEELARELAIVARLRRYADAAGPDRETRERIRERILDTAALDTVGGSTDIPRGKEHAARRPARPRTRASRQRNRPRGQRPANPRAARTHRYGALRGRFAIVATAALCTLIMLSGLSVLLARDAQPGDALYSFRRITESAGIGLTFDNKAKAFKHLRYATERVREIDAMDNSPMATEQAYRLAFADFDDDAAAGARGLTTLGTSSDASLLTSLRDWADDAYTQIVGLRDGLPTGVRASATSSAELLSEITNRVDHLRARLRCDTITAGGSDRLGRLPATAPCGSDATAAGARDRQASPGAQGPEQSGTHRSRRRAEPPGTKEQNPPGMRKHEPSTGPHSRRPAPAGGSGGKGPTLHLPLPINLPPLPSVPPILPGLPNISVK
jgi:Domain of unknown function (DUF5667)